ncbi:MAG: hypothetical protein M3N93_12650 [Acidobacteriota bacterium]|nr:hypothetical protein [Acidobacteriota bacterium]
MKSHRALMLLAGLAAVSASGQTTTPIYSTGQAARLVIGQKRFAASEYNTTDTLLGSPTGITYSNGVLWVVDANRVGATPDNNRILRFSDVASYPGPLQDPTISGNTCGVCRGVASLVLGQPDFVSSGFPLTPNAKGTTLRNPSGVATDGQILVVADTDNNRILIWTTLPQVNGQPANLVIGQADFSHNSTSVPPNAKSLRGPSGVWLADGKLYVADTQDNRILIYNQIPTTNNAAADVVIGQPNFTSFLQPNPTQSNGTPTASNMQDPVSVTTDGTRMFVTDLGQHRVLIWNTIPTTNGAPADIALGQINLTTAISNNSYKQNTTATDSDGHPTNVTPVMCQSNAAYAASVGQTGSSVVDSTTGTTLYPARCAATLSLPRFALSDGTRLYVADGGNDRVLVYNSMPTRSGQPADVILGQPDEFSDNTGQNPDGSDAFQTPFSLAYDGLNLYVGDTFNRRVVVYTPGIPNIPLGGRGVLNAASLTISALGSVAMTGSIKAKDTVTVTIAGTGYTYTVVSSDTLTTVVQGLVKKINNGSKPDPNVIATTNEVTNTLVLTARTPGSAGGNITLTASVSSGAQITATASGTTLTYSQNSSEIAPGTLITVSGTNLCDHTTVGAGTPYLPATLFGCELYIDGQRAPLLYVSPTQINAQMPVEYSDRTTVSMYARDTHADGSISVTTPIGITIVPQNPGIFAEYGTDPRPGIVYHGSSNAVSVVSVGASSIHAGDVGTLTIGGTAYTYTVLSTDTLTTVRDAFVKLINNAPDPNVYAGPVNENSSIALVARQAGAAGEGIAVTESVTGTSNTLTLTVYNTPTCCDNSQGGLVTADNPAVPGEVVYLFATGLGPTNPSDVDTGAVTPGGKFNPPASPVDSIQIDGTPANVLSASLVSGMVGVYYVQFQIGTTTTTDLEAKLTIAQKSYVSNVVKFPVVAPAAASARKGTPDARTTRQ